MRTPAQRHFQRMQAGLAASAGKPGQRQSGDQYELMMAALYEARRTLKNIKSIELKIEKKRELLPQFDSYVQGVLRQGNGAQDDVLMTIMIWLLDTGDLNGALNIAQYAIEHQLTTPDRYERDTASLVTEQVAEEALKLLAAADESTAQALFDTLSRTDSLTAGRDMHDQIRSKLHKAIGYALTTCGNTAQALNHLNRALELNSKAGVKKDIERLERELKKQHLGASN